MAILGEHARVLDFGLAGAVVLPAESPEDVRLAWARLEPDIMVVILTPSAANALGPVCGPLTVIMADRAGEPQ
ncbi:hypothetical protein [Nonomuraea basaltis]|uniref:hypothetical protein n=1 Tax=Nonomuraea basaltis TaxID=2495887 RepID=UPI001980509A|nr:hypothetical protein [Nonomuraea basaltis]